MTAFKKQEISKLDINEVINQLLSGHFPEDGSFI